MPHILLNMLLKRNKTNEKKLSLFFAPIIFQKSSFWQESRITFFNCVTTGVKWIPFTHIICDALHDLVPFVQFKKREKHPWRSVTLVTRINSPPWVFFKFFNIRNGTKLCKASQMQTTESLLTIAQYTSTDSQFPTTIYRYTDSRNPNATR